ncbi:MAG: ComEC/Rec2 family competence protein [Elusimicrobiota bacterium]|nr:ComEC/Rec2 family competence protein [Elusimicrobiota bacterium]
MRIKAIKKSPSSPSEAGQAKFKIKNVMLNLFQHLFRPRNKFGVTLRVILHFTFYIFNCLFSGCATLPKEPPKPKVYLEVPANEYKLLVSELVVTFIDVGQGDSIFIKTPGGKYGLIDSGGTPYWSPSAVEPGEETVVPFLESRKVKKLDFVIATHADGDHIGGLPAVLKRFPVGIVYENGIISDQPEYEELHKVIDDKKIITSVLKQGDVFDVDPSVKFEVFAPPKDFYFDGENNNAIAVRLIYGDVSFLFTADIEYEAEDSILHVYGNKIRSNIMKIGHHGSATSTSEKFLKAVNPEIAVIPVGARNNFGHPYSGVLAKLQDADINIYRTDEDGNITVRTDGKKFIIESEKNP